jgi:hypothetical protein
MRCSWCTVKKKKHPQRLTHPPENYAAARAVLGACCAASDKMQHEQDKSHHQGEVNEGGGQVKCEKSQQPENDQNCGDYPKHVSIPLRLSAKTSECLVSRTASMPLRVRENSAQAAD